jgi:hypothetical protein
MQKSRDWIEDVLDPRPRIIEPGPVPTIGEFLGTDAKWCWAYCERIGCGHSAPIALAPFAIRWGMGASTDLIRERLRCSKCGRKGGVAIKRPSWNWRGYAVWPSLLQ